MLRPVESQVLMLVTWVEAPVLYIFFHNLTFQVPSLSEIPVFSFCCRCFSLFLSWCFLTLSSLSAQYDGLGWLVLSVHFFVRNHKPFPFPPFRDFLYFLSFPAFIPSSPPFLGVPSFLSTLPSFPFIASSLLDSSFPFLLLPPLSFQTPWSCHFFLVALLPQG